MNDPSSHHSPDQRRRCLVRICVRSMAGLAAAHLLAGHAVAQPASSATSLTSTSLLSGVNGSVAQTVAGKMGERLSSSDFGVVAGAQNDPFGTARQRFKAAGGGVLYLPSAGAKGWQASSYGNPEGMSFEADGPNIDSDRLLGYGDGTWTWGKAWAARLPGNNTQGVTAYAMTASTPGSGSANTDQTILSIRALKDGYSAPGSARVGGLGGINIAVFNGAPTGKVNDTFAYNAFVQVGYASGFAVISENKIQEHCSNNVDLCFEQDVQQGVEDSASNTHIGENWTADLGTHTTLFRTVGSTAGGNQTGSAYKTNGVGGRWSNILYNQLDGVVNYRLTDTGSVVTSTDGTPATALTRTNVSGTDTVLNGRGTVISTLDQNGNFKIAGKLLVQGIEVAGTNAPLYVTSGLSVGGGAILGGGTVFQNDGMIGVAHAAPGITWNGSNGGGEADLVVPGDAGSSRGFSVYQEGTSDTAGSAKKVWGVDGSGNVTVTGNETVSGAIQPGSFTTATLPSPCKAGQQLYASDGLKPGEPHGSGSGVPVFCSPAAKGSPLTWLSVITAQQNMN